MVKRVDNDWPGPDDKLVVTEMLNNPHSPHWDKCSRFLEYLVRVSNLSEEDKKDVTQEAMLSVLRYLPDFQYNCRLRTWLGRVVNTRVTDAYRKQTRNNHLLSSPNDSAGNEENEMLEIPAPITTEGQCIVNERLREAMSGMLEYLRTHAKPERNRQILQRVLLDQHSLQEVAQELNVPVPVVRYVVQSFRRYLQDSMREQSISPGDPI